MASMGDHDYSTFLDLDLDSLSGFYPPNEHLKSMQEGEKQQQPPGLMASGDGSGQQPAIFDFQPSLDIQFSLANNVSLAAQAVIPPTPSSVELHADSVQYFQQQLEAQQRALIDQYNLRKPDPSQFTPVRSPLEHPHDVRYANNNVSSNYTVPGAYFSPLTSPALDGQAYPFNANAHAPGTTPGEQDPNVAEASGNQSGRTSQTKSRKRTNASRSTNVAPRTRAIVQRKPTRTSNQDEDAMDIVADNEQGAQSSSPDARDSSMGPPLHPASATQSPALAGQVPNNGMPTIGHATPSSLMRMPTTRNSPRDGATRSAPSSHPSGRVPLPPLTLPESATSAALSPDDGDLDAEMDSPSRKTPKVGPLSTPSESLRRPNSTSALSSPLLTDFSSKRTDSKGRLSKKRSSVSNSNLVSPALRPKISPSIKPLLPEGAPPTDDAHTAFLTSRSNYQNLIEGTHLPGVSYPSELSANLTSKRTSHKIAEQGRRNRINLALQEMHKLLPKTTPKLSTESQDSAKDEEGGAKGANKSSGNSKAATVESAIDYIKALKKESEDMFKVAEEKDKECEELKKKIQAMQQMMSEKGLSPLEE